MNLNFNIQFFSPVPYNYIWLKSDLQDHLGNVIISHVFPQTMHRNPFLDCTLPSLWKYDLKLIHQYYIQENKVINGRMKLR